MLQRDANDKKFAFFSALIMEGNDITPSNKKGENTMSTNTVELNPAAKKLLIAKVNRKLIKAYDDLAGELNLDTIDMKQLMHEMVDTMIPIPEYGVEINVYDLMSSACHVVMADKAKILRQIVTKTIGDAIDNGYIKLIETKEEDSEEG